jgi:hypothetical protein
LWHLWKEKLSKSFVAVLSVCGRGRLRNSRKFTVGCNPGRFLAQKRETKTTRKMLQDPTEPVQKFEYAVAAGFTHKIELTAHEIRAKIGLRKINFPLEQLRHIFVQRLESAGMDELILCQQLPGGKLKSHRFPAKAGEAGFRDAVDAIVTAKPEADIRRMDPLEARKIMGTSKTHKWVLVALVPIVTLVLAIIGLPAFIHGFDSGHADVAAAQLATDQLPNTRNLTLNRAVAAVDFATELTTTTTRKGTSTTSVDFFVPVIDPAGPDDQNVHLVIQCKKADLAELRGAPEIPGVLRNVLWEGVPDDVSEHMTTEMNLPLATVVHLFDYKANTKTELGFWTAIVGGTFVLMSVISFFVYRKGFMKKV